MPAKVEKRQLLDGPIRVILYMRIDGKRVVPRLEFAINLVAALPPAVAGPLRQAAGHEAEDEPVAMLKRTLMVNPEAAGLPEPYRRLTEKPDHVPQWCSKHWLQAGERKGGGKTPRGVMMSGARGRGRDLRLWAPDFMAAGGLSLFGVLDDGREIVAELFSNSSPSRVNVFDRRVAIRRFLCHRSTTPRACR